MNKTRKLTQGAMLLAIVGALMLIDLRFGFLFAYLIVLMQSVIIIIYSTMHTIKDGIVLTVALGILSFVIGASDPAASYALFPAAAITGLTYSYGLKKNWNKRALFVTGAIAFVIGEYIAALVISPLLFDRPLSTQLELLSALIVKYKEILGSTIDSFISSVSGNSFANKESIKAIQAVGEFYESIFNTLLLNIKTVFIVITFIVGLMEGLLVHLLAIILLKRMRIKDIPVKSFIDVKPNKILSYVAMLLMFGIKLLLSKLEVPQVALATLLIVEAIAFIYLLWNGYKFSVVYLKLVYNKNLSFLVIILCIFSVTIGYAVAIIGFLYGAGPLYDKLMEKKAENEKNNII